MQVSVAFDEIQASAYLNLDERTPIFAIFATAHSAATGFKWVSTLQEVKDGEANANWVLPAGVFARDLTINVGVMLKSRTSSTEHLAPPINGILMDSTYLCELEGSLSRAAVEVFDFEGDLEESLWEIYMNLPREVGDWEIADLSSCISVRLNKQKYHQLGSEAAYNKALAGEFLSAIVDAALSEPEVARNLLSDSQPQDAGSLFKSCRSALTAVFGDQDYETVMMMYSRNRQHHRARIQAIASIAAKEQN
jgi:hypothetical protein